MTEVILGPGHDLELKKMRQKLAAMLAFSAIAKPYIITNERRNFVIEMERKPKAKKLKQGQLLFCVVDGLLIEMDIEEYFEDGTDWILARTRNAALKKAKNKGYKIH